MPSIKVSYAALEDAFLFAEETRHSWLDKRTGRILSYSDEAKVAVEEGGLTDLPDWMQPDVEAATEVLRAFGELPGQAEQESVASGPSPVDHSMPGLEPGAGEDNRGDSAVDPSPFVSIEPIPSHETFQFLADFTDELPASVARDALEHALRGSRPFRRFKNALNDYPKERERWFEYEAKRRREYIEEWALDQGVELDFGAQVS
jgi:hypothetical protein